MRSLIRQKSDFNKKQRTKRSAGGREYSYNWLLLQAVISYTDSKVTRMLLQQRSDIA